MRGNHQSKGSVINPGKAGRAGIPGSQKRRKKTKGSMTPGKIKCSSCQATWQQRNWAKKSRSYKLPEFGTITTQMNRKAANEQVKG